KQIFRSDTSKKDHDNIGRMAGDDDVMLFFEGCIPSQGHRAEGGTSEKGSDPDVFVACPEALNQGATDPSHQEREIRKEKRCSKGWKRVYSTGYETRGILYPHIRVTQGVSHTTTVTEILKVVTKVPAQKEQNLLLRNTITKEHPHARRKYYHKVMVAQEDTRSYGQKSRDQALRMTIYPSHGYARKLIRSLPASAILISRRGPACQVTSKHMSEVRIRKITLRSFWRQKKWNVRKCQHGATCSNPHLPDPLGDVKGALEIMRISGFMHGITKPELIKRLHDKIPKSVDKMMRITTSFLRGRWQLATKSGRSHFRPVIPAEIGMPTLRIAKVDMVQNDEALEINLDLLEETREQAAIREEKSKVKLEKYYNLKVRSISFKPGELVYRSNDASRAEEVGKLGPKWKGPYEVTGALGRGTYKLRDRDGKQLSRTWNVRNLKKCYVHEM
ncbi:hypothetical protein Tco_0718322, partial [Tanacetum coccineum]